MVLKKTNEVGWKKFMEGMNRGDAGPFKQRNRMDGDHSIREYFDGEKVKG